MIGIPKPQKCDRLSLQNRRERKKLDREYQASLPDRFICACGHTVDKQTGSRHHIIRRWIIATRFNTKISLPLCFRHHEELHGPNGERRFFLKYMRQIRRYYFDAYVVLCRKYASKQNEIDS